MKTRTYTVTVRIMHTVTIAIEAPTARDAEAVADGMTGRQVANNPTRKIAAGHPADGTIAVLAVEAPADEATAAGEAFLDQEWTRLQES